MPHTPIDTYNRILILAAKYAFQVRVDWDSNACEVSPRGLSVGKLWTVDLENTTPDQAEEQFGEFYSIGSIEELPLIRKARKARPKKKEKPHGRK